MGASTRAPVPGHQPKSASGAIEVQNGPRGRHPQCFPSVPCAAGHSWGVPTWGRVACAAQSGLCQSVALEAHTGPRDWDPFPGPCL